MALTIIENIAWSEDNVKKQNTVANGHHVFGNNINENYLECEAILNRLVAAACPAS